MMTYKDTADSLLRDAARRDGMNVNVPGAIFIAACLLSSGLWAIASAISFEGKR